MGLFDFLKKKPTEEEKAQAGMQGNSQTATQTAEQEKKQSAPLSTQEIYGDYDEELKSYASRISADQKKEIL